MSVDEHTPCPACAVHVRNLYAAAQVLLTVLAEVDVEGFPVREVNWIAEPIENVQIAVRHLTPFIEAHLENQLHALSPELAGVRNPTTSATLELSRILPFPEAHRG